MVGKMKRVNLRDVWKNEARDFTDWLFSNLEILAEEIGFPILPDAQKKRIGTFEADILAKTQNNEAILIENQLEKTDHKHLGQILLYVSNLDAKIAIWVTSNPSIEHVKAIEWLNQMESGVSFYIVKVEAYTIDDYSNPAAKFTIVTGPNKDLKQIGRRKKEIAKREESVREFWTGLLEKSKILTKLHSNITPSFVNWISTGAGKSGISYNYVINNDNASVELYLDRGKGFKIENKNRFDYLYAHKSEIEKEIGLKLSWEKLDNKRASRIAIKFSKYGLKNRNNWDVAQNEMIEKMIRFEKTLKPFIRSMK